MTSLLRRAGVSRAHQPEAPWEQERLDVYAFLCARTQCFNCPICISLAQGLTIYYL